jgi:hypothetical protein
MPLVNGAACLIVVKKNRLKGGAFVPGPGAEGEGIWEYRATTNQISVLT